MRAAIRDGNERMPPRARRAHTLDPHQNERLACADASEGGLLADWGIDVLADDTLGFADDGWHGD